MKKTIVKSVLGAGFALAAGVVFAADVSQTFDELTAGAVSFDDTKQKWSGDGTVVQEARGANNPTMGSAISADASMKYLAVAGTVSCTNKANVASATPYQADFLVNIAEPCDDLSTDGLGGAQIAVAAGTTVDDQGRVAICVCRGSTPSWVTTDALVATGSWARVSLYFDYSASPAKCRVSVNGRPAKYSGSEYYDLIASSTHVKQLDFVGVAKIDDVFIASGYETKTVIIAGDEKAVKVETLAKYGVSYTELATGTAGTGGLTPWKRYEAGLALNDAAADFEPTAMALTSATAATITVPFVDDNNQAYTVTILDENNVSTTVNATKGAVVDGKVPLSFSIPATPGEEKTWGKVLKFTVNASL